MARYSGIYLFYEGTTSQCDTVQQRREAVFDTSSGLMRYMDSAGVKYYMGVPGGDSLWIVEEIWGTLGVNIDSTYSWAHVGASGSPEGIFLETVQSSNTGEILSVVGAGDGASRRVWLCGWSGVIITDYKGVGIELNTYGGGLLKDGTDGPINLFAGTSISLTSLEDMSLHAQGNGISLYAYGVSGISARARNGALALSGYTTNIKGGIDLLVSSPSISLYATNDDITLDSNRHIILTATTGDVYSTAWQSYVPTVSGWFPGVTKTCYYKTIGDLVFVEYSISGSGNGDYTGFSLPYSGATSFATVPVAGYNISAGGGHESVNPSGIAGFSSGDWIYFPINGADQGADYATVWGSGVAGDLKWLCGHLWYQRS